MKGLVSDNIELILSEKGLPEEELNFLLKESDLIFIEHLLAIKKAKEKKKKPRLFFKTLILVISLFSLLAIFLGHARVSFILLILFWGALRSAGVLSCANRRCTADSKIKKMRPFYQ